MSPPTSLAKFMQAHTHILPVKITLFLEQITNLGDFNIDVKCGSSLIFTSFPPLACIKSFEFQKLLALYINVTGFQRAPGCFFHAN